LDAHEVAAVLAYIGRLDPRTIRTGTGEARDQIAQWQELLDAVPFATDHGWDVREATRAHVLDSPSPILPVDVARRWRAHRRDRLDRHSDPTPAADPADPAAWRAELLDARNAVAVGVAAPSTHRQITENGPPRDFEERLRAVGSRIPFGRPRQADPLPTDPCRAGGRSRERWPRRAGASGATRLRAPRAASGGQARTAPPRAMLFAGLPTRRVSTSPLPGWDRQRAA